MQEGSIDRKCCENIGKNGKKGEKYCGLWYNFYVNGK